MKKTCGVVGSLLLHIIVIIFLLSATSVAKKLPKVPANVPVHALAHEDRLKGEEGFGNGLACDGYHYTGIGIRLNYGSGAITDVGPNTPAEKAGLREGDVMLDPNEIGPDRFEIGKAVVIHIEREGQKMEITLRIGRICNE